MAHRLFARNILVNAPDRQVFAVNTLTFQPGAWEKPCPACVAAIPPRPVLDNVLLDTGPRELQVSHSTANNSSRRRDMLAATLGAGFASHFYSFVWPR